MTTLREMADSAFQRALDLIGDKNQIFLGNGNQFWHQADTLDACVQYLVLTKQQDTYNLVANAINYVFDVRMSLAPDEDWAKWSRYGSGPWADDYGWWGIALVRAYENRKILGYSDDFSMNVLALAKKCFYGLAGTWDTSEAVPGTNIHGGAWNHQDADQALTGRNNVTNEVLWILSQRLFNVTGEKVFSEQNMASAKFFWEGSTAGCLYTNGLVLERMKGMVHENCFPNTKNLWYWIGDQGLFIGACLGNDLRGGTWFNCESAWKISQAVLDQKMIDATVVIHDTLPPNSDFNDDYATGKGAFMRNWVLFNDPRFAKWTPSNFKSLIDQNAVFAWYNRPWKDRTGNIQFQFGFNWNPTGKPFGQGGEPTFPGNTESPSNFSCLVLQTAGLSALNALLVIHPDSESKHIEDLVPLPGAAG